jgi:asparagine synthase (glutamine-hydrolysing)
MCGIWALIEKKELNKDDLVKYLGDFWSIKHRGPDNSHLQTFDKTYVGFHRLAIMDTSIASNQPYVIHDHDRTIVFICNGEIYNFSSLDRTYDLNINKSDCLTIPKLYIKLGEEKWLKLFHHEIKGEFAFIMFEFDNINRLSKYFVGRDMVGVRPLYTVRDSTTFDLYSSEIKGMMSYPGTIEEFKPGTIRSVYYNSFEYIKFTYDFNSIYNRYSKNTLDIEDNLQEIRYSVIESVRRRLVADRPIAFLLSGGVDSSLVAAIGSRILNQPIKTFCCGIKGSTDMEYAKLVANHIGSIHTEVYFTEEEGLELIKDVVYTTETWDTTTVRASVGQYIVSRYISQNTDCKVVLVGEGPDEVCSSYLFNYYAPSAKDLHDAAENYVKEIHMYDGRRADRCISRWGLESRIPLLDPEFISAYWNVNAELRMPTYNMEKYMLRKAFDRDDLLPKEVLWRKKEAFSDGVSSKEKSWYQVIQEYTEKQVETELDFYHTSEATYYRKLFREWFGLNRDTIIPHFWQPKWDKDGNVITSYVDPSARTLKIYS